MWEEYLQDLISKVTEYRKKVSIKVEQIRPTVRMSEFERRTLELQEKALLEKMEKRNQSEKIKLEEGLAQAKAKLMAFMDDHTSLTVELTAETTPFAERDDVGIGSAMHDLKEWKKTFARICTNYREYERLARVHGEQDLLVNEQQGEMEVAEEMFNTIKSSFEKAKKDIETLDASRGLYTNHTHVGEKLDYPKFSGASSEDFTKFYDKMVKALRHNKVSKADQVERLRKYLSGFALNLVPESTESVEKAFATLKAAFGDPKKVLEDKMKKLKLVGDLPGEKLSNNKSGFRRQEEWYLTIEGLLHEIIELGKRDEDLAYEAFSENTFNYVLSLFPISLVDKLEEVQGTRKEKLEAVLTKLGAFRDKARRLGRVYGDKVPPGVSSSGGERGATPSKQAEKLTAQPGTVFKAAQEDPDCRICKQLESEGYTDKFFVNHLSSYSTGCPHFMAMKIAQRKIVAIKAKLCVWCLDPEVKFDMNHRETCRVNSGKIKRFTCDFRDCKLHMWVCVNHKQHNLPQNKKHQEDLKKKGYDMALPNWCVRAEEPKQLLDSDVATKAVTKAVRKAAKDNSIQVTPVPAGRPMFLFFHCKGQDKGANCFFDKGCTEAVFREGIPGKELVGQKTMKGPFVIGGVGGLECKANDEWLVSLEKTDGHRQLIRGLTVDKVTEDFPLVKLGRATAEIKNSSSDEWIRSCKVPKQAGGVTDALIGIHYNLIHPVPVHTLESGLCIYRSKLAPHKNGFEAMIGGPHSSFDVLADLTGGTARVVAQFVQGLEKFRTGDWTAPKIPENPMTNSELLIAKTMNACEGYRPFQDVFDIEQEEEERKSQFEEILELIDMEPVSTVSSGNQTLPLQSCVTCKLVVTDDIWLPEVIALETDTRFTTDEKILKIKKNWSIMESGLEI